MDPAIARKVAALLQAAQTIKRIKEDGVPSKIEEGLYLGSIGAAHNKSVLEVLNVTHVLTVASNPPPYANNFTYKVIKVNDREDTDIAHHFDECFEFIDEAKHLNGGVLVHCFAGKSRSVTIVVAYLMKKHHMSLRQAMELVRERRPQASPNSGFLLQLQNFEKLLQGKLA